MSLNQNLASEMYKLAERLFPICRSLSGSGVRETLRIINEYLSELKTYEVPTGTQCFDWKVPNEWNIRDAYVVAPSGEKIIDFKQHNISVVGYSEPVDKTVSLAELQEHLYSLPERPDAIPYVTSYYHKNWGFCLAHNKRQALEEGNYRVRIDSTLAPGHLSYGELIIPGASDHEIFLSTYICHPSLANNEISGPVVATYLARWLLQHEHRRYTYRIVFIPETIGSLIYLSKHVDYLKSHVIAGFNISCVGDDRCYSYLPSRRGNTLADRVALHVLQHTAPDFKRYTYLDRGSDERQYCSPHVDLPIALIMRSKFGAYPEYHTSDDNLSLISPSGLYGAYQALSRCITAIERNDQLVTTVLGEPQLSSRGLYPKVSDGKFSDTTRIMMDLLAYCDGEHDLLQIANIINVPVYELYEIVDTLKANGLLRVKNL